MISCGSFFAVRPKVDKKEPSLSVFFPSTRICRSVWIFPLKQGKIEVIHF